MARARVPLIGRVSTRPCASFRNLSGEAETILQRHRPGWQLEFELFFARHGAARGVLIVLVFAAVSGLAVGVDLSNYDPFGPGLGWSPGIVLVALIAAYLLNRGHAEQ